MKITKPTVEIIDHNNLLRNIELGGRVCYKSEGAMGEGSDERLIEKLKSLKHESVFEHGVITVKFLTDRGVTHELVRHRLAAFSQESTRYCVAGSTALTTTNPHNKITVGELFANKCESRNGAWKRMKIRQMNEATGELQFANVENVFSMGRKPVIKVRTKLGYELTLTPDHEIYTRDGYMRAGELTLSSDVAVNGTTVLYQSEPWLRNQYTTLNKTAVAIAAEFGFNVSTIKKWVRKHMLPQKPKSYWNVGREAWNKGLDESDPRVANQVQALRENHWDEGRYTGKVAKERISKLTVRTYGKTVEEACEICGGVENLHVHHVDEDRENNSPGNLLTVCASCHQRVHAKNLMAVVFDRVVEIEDAGIEDVFDVSMASEFHNFVANGVVVHNCNYSKDKFDNEITVVDPFFFDPDEELKEVWIPVVEWENGGFGPRISGISNGTLPASMNSFDVWLLTCLWAEWGYNTLTTQFKRSAQEARSVLPNSLKTEIQVTANVREFRHILNLRCSRDAHPQIRQIMVPLLRLLAEKWPILFSDIAEKHVIGGNFPVEHEACQFGNCD